MFRRDITILISLLVTHSQSVRNNYNFFPNLPVGEYRIYIKSIVTCTLPANGTDKLTMRHSFYLNKTSRNTSELRGSIWNDKLFDDSLTFNVNFAVKDSIGGWKDNALVYKAPKACSMSKFFIGDLWPQFLNAFGVNNTNCPILPGTFVSKGIDVSNLESKLNVPKTFFYGIYKVRVYFTNKHETIRACSSFVMEIKRPWEEE